MDCHEFAEMSPQERAEWKRNRRIEKARISAALAGVRYVPGADDARADAETLSAASKRDRVRMLAEIENEHGADYVGKVLAILSTFKAEG